MPRPIRLFTTAVASLVMLGSLVQAQEETTQRGDLATLRQLIEQQNKQLEALTQQVARLATMIETNQASTSAAAATPQNMPPAEQPKAPSPMPSVENAPRAEAVHTGPTHVVAKGETLTSIARQYKITIGDLQRVNRIQNDRTLQIGQTLVIPTPPAAEPAAESTPPPAAPETEEIP